MLEPIIFLLQGLQLYIQDLNIPLINLPLQTNVLHLQLNDLVLQLTPLHLQPLNLPRKLTILLVHNPLPPLIRLPRTLLLQDQQLILSTLLHV